MKTAKQYFIEEMSGEPLTQDCVIEHLERYAKLSESNDKLNELFHEYSHSNTKQTFESFVVNEKGYKLYKMNQEQLKNLVTDKKKLDRLIMLLPQIEKLLNYYVISAELYNPKELSKQIGKLNKKKL